MESVPEGTVIVIGGAEDKVRDRVILSRFVTLAGGPDAVVAVISTASSMGLEAGERYREVFGQLGGHCGGFGNESRPYIIGTAGWIVMLTTISRSGNAQLSR